VEQYLEYIRAMEISDMNIASEFVEMAARLVYIKTVSLLPVHEEEAQNLKEELQGELLEYQDCKTMAKKLSEQVDLDHLSRQPQKIPPDMKYKRLHEPIELFRAYLSAVGRGKRNLPPPIEAFTSIVAHKIVPIASRVKYIMTKLFKQKKQKFNDFFVTSQSRSEMVATFLALLSLTKDKKITVTGEGEDMEIEMLGDDPDYELGEDYFEG
ncbi:MAG: segregation/condensation protein A, partial [Clostridia bacterium]|nr:segregation/condensation protein A [Clostridia bacterium]